MSDQTHDSHSHGDGHGEKVGHIVPPRILFVTALGLLMLTGLTVAAAGVNFADYDYPELNIWVALGIAAVKGSLVALFFMHLRWDRPFNGIIFVLSIAFVALFIGFAMTDSLSYQKEIIKGDGKLVVQKLDELKAEAAKEAEHGGAVHEEAPAEP